MKIAGLTGGLAVVTTVVGVNTIESVSGEPSPDLSPYEKDADIDQAYPGLHILVVEGRPAGNPFSLYLEEILITEGLMVFIGLMLRRSL